MPLMYDLFNREKMDLNKKNIIVFLMDQTLKKEIYSVTYSYVFNTLKILSKDFNLILATKNGGHKWTENYVNHPEFGNYAYLTFDKQKLYGSTNAKQMPHEKKVEYILETFAEMEKEDAWLFDNLVGTVSSQFIVPSLDIGYEIISDDEKQLAKRKRAVEKFQDGLVNNKLVSHCAFIHKPLGFTVELSAYLMRKYQHLWHYNFCHDTGSTWLHYMPQYNPLTKNVKSFYFIDDKRGIRDFVKYPLTELQDFYGKKLEGAKYYNQILTNKKHDFIFGGSFPFDINYRVEAWYRFFHDLKVDGKIRTQTTGKPAISNKNALLKAEEQKFPRKYQNNTAVEEFIKDILNNKLVDSTLSYNDYNDELKDYMFTIVLKCFYGKHDSLNFRVVNSLYFGTVPLIDVDYDIDNLQMPKHFKDKLIVKSHKDIEEKVKYYKENPDEYLKLFWELYNYYIDEKYFKESYWNDDFKKEYFGELYK